MVGRAVCSELLAHGPGRLVVAARRAHKAQRAVEALRAEHPGAPVELVPAWGDVFLRAEWQTEAGDARAAVLADPERRRRLIQDVAQPLTDDLIAASLLGRLILGAVPALGGARADVVIDCMNTATAVGYQNVYALTQRLAALAEEDAPDTDWPGEVEALLAALSVPQLVRHVQLLYAAMRRAGTRAYVKVGTSGTGGWASTFPTPTGRSGRRGCCCRRRRWPGRRAC